MTDRDDRVGGPLLTVKEVAALLRVGRDTAYALVADGSIPSIRLGRQIRVPRAALIAHLEVEARKPNQKAEGRGSLRGSIRKRSGDSWTLTVFVGVDPETGKELRRYTTVKGTKKEAQAVLAQMVTAVETGLDFDSTQLTVAEYLMGRDRFEREWEGWLEFKRQGLKPLKPRTHRRYAELIRLHALPTIGNVPLAKLKPLHIEQVYSTARKKGLSVDHDPGHFFVHQMTLRAPSPEDPAGFLSMGRAVADRIGVSGPEPARRKRELRAGRQPATWWPAQTCLRESLLVRQQTVSLPERSSSTHHPAWTFLWLA
jgi:excisionase family DNA binding protein